MTSEFQLYSSDLRADRRFRHQQTKQSSLKSHHNHHLEVPSSSLSNNNNKNNDANDDFPWKPPSASTSLFSHSPTKFVLAGDNKIGPLPPNFETFHPMLAPSPIKLLDLQCESTPTRVNTMVSRLAASSSLTDVTNKALPPPSSSSSAAAPSESEKPTTTTTTTSALSKQGKSAYKRFYNELRALEKAEKAAAAATATNDGDHPLLAAFTFAREQLSQVPTEIHWKVCSEIADLAKRMSRFEDARQWYNGVHTLEPTCVQAWLEHSKLEQECGNSDEAKAVLRTGLQYCVHNETLLLKYLQVEEQSGSPDEARFLLSELRNVETSRVWRVLLGGAVMEARFGNDDMARKVLQYLMEKVPQYGCVWQEAALFEERRDRPAEAESIVTRGLVENRGYAPLLFSNIRLRIARAVRQLPSVDWTGVNEAIESAKRCISRDQLWKVMLEEAHVNEMRGEYDLARAAYKQGLQQCPVNLRWKIWLSGARLEIRLQRMDVARQLLKRSLDEVGGRMANRAAVLIEATRLEDYCNNVDTAREIISMDTTSTTDNGGNNINDDALSSTSGSSGSYVSAADKHQWKLHMERIMLELRNQGESTALMWARSAVQAFPSAGRLWAVLIQLEGNVDEDGQMAVFQRAVKMVPKSGEVWAEGARIHMNPTSRKYFNLTTARHYVDQAMQFTPQYGDSFVEYLRLLVITEGGEVSPRAFDRLQQRVATADPNYGTVWSMCRELQRRKLRHQQLARDPNAGVAVACTPIQACVVLRSALDMVCHHVRKYSALYQQAVNSHYQHRQQQIPWPEPLPKRTVAETDGMGYFNFFGDLDGSVKLVT